jgi:hypothetical protein
MEHSRNLNKKIQLIIQHLQPDFFFQSQLGPLFTPPPFSQTKSGFLHVSYNPLSGNSLY